MREKLAYCLYISLSYLNIILPAHADSPPVTIFAAASLTTIMNDVANLATRAGLPKCRCVFASSAALARQIIDGAPSDIFISANRHWVNQVVKVGVMDGETRQTIVRNKLILVVNKNNSLNLLPVKWERLPATLGDNWVAMADPDYVPAGVYGKAALKHFGVWERLKPRIARAPNVRAALALVARGEANAGIVYNSDLRVSDKVKFVATFPSTSHPSIEYTAVISTNANRSYTDAYFAFLMSSDVQARFLVHGFLPVDG